MQAALPLLALGTLAFGVALAQDTPDHGRDIAKAGKLYAKSCSSCHLPPDPAFETDRAWLHQVFDTA
jgi:mono/diheme cytochrome c family protein